MEKEKLIDIFYKLDNKRDFTIYSPFEIYKLIIDARLIIEKIDKSSFCYSNLKKAEKLYQENKDVPFEKSNNNRFCLSMIQLSQYPIKEFADTL